MMTRCSKGFESLYPKKDCRDPEIIASAKRRGAIDRDVDETKYDIVKTYRVVRMKFAGYGMTVPERMPDGGIKGRTINFEVIDFGGKKYRCAKDHQDHVIYIDTHAMEEAIESSCRCGEGPCDRHGTKVSTPNSYDEA
jgi:hypothetical protein